MLSLVVVMFCAPAPGTAQAIQRPSRPYRGLFGGGPPPDPNRTRQELTLTASLLGGYDDMLTPGAGQSSTPIDPTQATASGYTGTGDVSLQYFLGRAQKSLAINGRAYSTAYSFLSSYPVGGSLDVRGSAPLGRRNRFTGSQSLSYAPNLVLGAFAPIRSEGVQGVLPDSGERSGLAQQRSIASNTNVGLERQWTTRQTTTLGYSYSQRLYLDDLGYDDSTQSIDTRYDWAFRRTMSVHTSYQASAAQYTDRTPGAVREIPLLHNHSIEVGGSYRRRVSPSRQVQLSGGGGSTYVESVTGEGDLRSHWMPSGHGMLDIDLGRSWALSMQYRRSATVLQGVTLESFAAHAATLGATGLVRNRIESAFAFSFSSGRSATGGGDNPARFVNYGGMAQFRYALTRCCAASLNYDYSYYRLRDITNLPPSFRPQYDRNGIRVGLTVWLPLYGSYGDRGARRQAPGVSQ